MQSVTDIVYRMLMEPGYSRLLLIMNLKLRIHSEIFCFLNWFCLYCFRRSSAQYIYKEYYGSSSKNSCEILHSPDPKFVGAAVIPDNDDRDDDKVYFFFTELETNPEGAKKAVHTYVGRVCAVRTTEGGRGVQQLCIYGLHLL